MPWEAWWAVGVYAGWGALVWLYVFCALMRTRSVVRSWATASAVALVWPPWLLQHRRYLAQRWSAADEAERFLAGR